MAEAAIQTGLTHLSYHSSYFPSICQETEKQCFSCLQEVEKYAHSFDMPISMGLTETQT